MLQQFIPNHSSLSTATLVFLYCLLSWALSSPVSALAEENPNPIDHSRVLFVSTQSHDEKTGATSENYSGQADSPFLSLEEARNEIRRLKTKNEIPDKGVVVILRGGTYQLQSPFLLEEEDSGTDKAPIVYMAFPGEEVRISGEIILSDFTSVSDPEILEQLVESAKAHVFQTDLKKQGIDDFGPPDGGGIEIYQNAIPLHLSRWPNEGFVKIKDLVVDDGHQIHGAHGSTVGKFLYEDDRPARWLKEKDPWLHGYWFWDWSDQRQQIDSIDVTNKQINLKQPYHAYGYRKGQWYYAFNLLSEIDSPGEYFIDREKGILYVWPLADIEDKPLKASVLENLVVTQSTSNFCFSGITFEFARGTAVKVNGGSHGIIDGCTVCNVGGNGIEVNGYNHLVSGCEIFQTGRGGVIISGGERKTLEPGNISVVDNHIHDYGRFYRMYQPGVSIHGVANHVANNLIHSAPHIGIYFNGNEHRIEYNEIHHVCLESNDAGAIYAGRDWTQRENIIRYNYMHDVSGFENKGCVGVYLDDMFASADIYGNIFYKVTAAAFIGGGRDCTIENNVFVDCDPAIHVDARALGWAHYHADEWIAEASSKGTILGIDYRKEPYASRYPELFNIFQKQPKAPEGNLIARNICTGGKWDRIEEAARPFLVFEDNLVNQDPMFVDPSAQNFTLKKNSPAYSLGFDPIPAAEIGLYRKMYDYSSDLHRRLVSNVGPVLSPELRSQFLTGLARKRLKEIPIN